MNRFKSLLTIYRNASPSLWAMLLSHEGRSMVTSAMHHHPPRRAMLYVPGVFQVSPDFASKTVSLCSATFSSSLNNKHRINCHCGADWA
jgi:hypothetical protein